MQILLTREPVEHRSPTSTKHDRLAPKAPDATSLPPKQRKTSYVANWRGTRTKMKREGACCYLPVRLRGTDHQLACSNADVDGGRWLRPRDLGFCGGDVQVLAWPPPHPDLLFRQSPLRGDCSKAVGCSSPLESRSVSSPRGSYALQLHPRLFPQWYSQPYLLRGSSRNDKQETRNKMQPVYECWRLVLTYFCLKKIAYLRDACVFVCGWVWVWILALFVFFPVVSPFFFG